MAWKIRLGNRIASRVTGLTLCACLLVCGALPSAILAQQKMQKKLPSSSVTEPSADVSATCPRLPSCPEGLAPPLPPPPLLKPIAPKVPKPVVDGAGLKPGTGRYAGMILIPEGPFEMGSPEGIGREDERPRRQVFLKSFYLAKHEVTVKEYCDFLNSSGNKTKDGSARVKLDHPSCPIVFDGKRYVPRAKTARKPVVCVSWEGAADYGKWAHARLPTAAEWEKAAVLSTPYPPGDRVIPAVSEGSQDVANAAPGLVGITGVVGNVWEWCSDWYSSQYYRESPTSNPVGPLLGSEKVIRGGSWASSEASRRTRNRYKASPRGYYRTVGFRLVKDEEGKK